MTDQEYINTLNHWINAFKEGEGKDANHFAIFLLGLRERFEELAQIPNNKDE